jgi:excisionase family DNA binding protein
VASDTNILATGATAPLALRPKDAAKALGIGARLLWSLTNQGVIPHIKLGRATLYPTDLLRAWLAEQAKGARR